ncbi:hypothetical protein GCM10012275_41870 [Longimycelium tulufanense]|uniref:Uncharacterized protein n=1 Tax=Longimycelium tulufanense TaxID=907463 RepID=A0A8J3CAV6_9PSEU|nr:hypothetical protein [Longimycelium tulufanense]GGM67010.1 hypothetical protein GCM10012275_41870 [Longimycelium tulufanense]
MTLGRTGRLARVSAAATLAAALGAAGALAGAGAATAAEPVVVGDCAASVGGEAGQPVSLAPGAIAGPVVEVVRAVPGGLLLADPAERNIRELPPIPLGTVPAGGGTIGGRQIAAAVVAELRKIPLLGPIMDEVARRVTDRLTTTCGITVRASNAAAAPVQDEARAVAERARPGGGTRPAPRQPADGQPAQPQPQQPPGQEPAVRQGAGPTHEVVGGGHKPRNFDLFRLAGWGWYDFGRVPFYDYSRLPFATPGGWAPSPGLRYGGRGGEYPPEFGFFGGPQAADNSVTHAGRAEALPPARTNRVGAGAVLAVLALATVTAGLVRAWALRRATR